MDLVGKTNNMCRSTKIWEMHLYMQRYKNKLNKNLTLEKFCEINVDDKIKRIPFHQNINLYISDYSDIEKIIKCTKGERVVIIKSKNKKYAYELQDFENFCTDEVYACLIKDIELNRVRYDRRIKRLDTALLAYKFTKSERDKRSKLSNANSWDTRVNVANCFLHSLKSISSHFKDKKYVDVFKNLSPVEKLKLANSELLKINKVLKLQPIKYSKLSSFINNCPSIIVFDNSELPYQSEAIIDFKVAEELQDHIKTHLNRICRIRELCLMDCQK